MILTILLLVNGAFIVSVMIHEFDLKIRLQFILMETTYMLNYHVQMVKMDSSWVILLGNILDHEIENLKESNPIFFISFMSSWNISSLKKKKVLQLFCFIYLFFFEIGLQRNLDHSVNNLLARLYLITMIKVISHISIATIRNFFCDVHATFTMVKTKRNWNTRNTKLLNLILTM